MEKQQGTLNNNNPGELARPNIAPKQQSNQPTYVTKAPKK